MWLSTARRKWSSGCITIWRDVAYANGCCTAPVKPWSSAFANPLVASLASDLLVELATEDDFSVDVAEDEDFFDEELDDDFFTTLCDVTDEENVVSADSLSEPPLNALMPISAKITIPATFNFLPIYLYSLCIFA